MRKYDAFLQKPIVKIVKPVVDKLGLSDAIDDNVWSVKDKGGIYFSAKQGEAYYLKEGRFENAPTSTEFLERIRNYLKDLK